MTYTTPAGNVSRLYLNMLEQPHLLIAGATGSGKSVVINGLMHAALMKAPCQVGFVLIDPKRVELVQYHNLQHVITYASEIDGIIHALNGAVYLMERRYTEMQAQGVRRYTGAAVYVVIDELADLLTTARRETIQQLCRLAQLGRAANIHLIAATQRPTRDIVNGQIKVNMDSRLALRCPTAQDSRNIINIKGAEMLPRYGKGLYLTPDTMQPVLVDIPYITDAKIADRVKWWTDQIPRRRRWWQILKAR